MQFPSLRPSKMNANKMPVIILILKNDDGVVFYKAFSPSSYTPPQDDEIDYDADFENFKMRMYSYINYNHNGIDNTTNLGKLLEVHSRHITTPLDQRGNTVWFSTYQHPDTTYFCVHRPSPIHFSQDSAIAYQNMQPALIHTSCEHIIV